MHFQRDYILRMIEMMGELFRRIGDMLDDAERLNELNRECTNYCSINLNSAISLDIASLTEILSPQSRLVLSEIFYIRAQASRMLDEDMIALYTKAVQLLASLSKDSLVCELRSQRMIEMLNAYILPLSSCDHMNIASFFTSAEKFSRAEDEVFRAVESSEDNQKYIIRGKEILTQMLMISDETLFLGGLTREEIATAIYELSVMEKHLD